MALIAHWPLNGDILDYSGNGFHLTNNGATINNEGKIGKCYEIQGRTKYFSIPLNFNKNLDVNNFSLSFWIKNINETNTEEIASIGLFGPLSGSRNFNLYAYNKSTSFHWSCHGLGNSTNNCLELNVWKFITMVIKNNNIKIYINNSLIHNTNGTNNLVVNNDIKFNIGTNDNNGTNLKYLINDFKIFNHELSKKEIKELYQTKILDWKFNECEEPTINLFPSNLQNYNYELNSIGGFVTQLSGTDNYLKITNEPGPCFNKILEYKGNNRIYKKMDILNNKIYTLSAWIYSETPFENIFTYELKGTDYDWQGKSVSHKGTGWEYLSLTTDLLTCNTAIYIFFYGNVNQIKKIDSIQLEEKNYPTPFIIKERKGKIIDSSGYKNHGLIEINSSPKWDENEYIFNGINSVIKTNKIILKKESSTFNFWIKMKEDRSFSICGLTNSTNTISLIDYINNPTTGKYFSAETKNNCNNFNSPILNNFNPLIYNMITIKFDNCKSFWYINGKNIGETPDYGIYNCGNSNNPNGSNNLTSLVDNCEINYFGFGAYQPRFNGFLKNIKHFATALSDSDIKELYENQLTIDKNNNINCNEIIEEKNLLNTNIIIKKSKEYNLNNEISILKYENKLSLKLKANAFYNGEYLNIFEEQYFKTNIQYEFNFNVNSNLIYQNNEVPGGFRIFYTDKSITEFTFKTSGTWQKRKIISNINKTIEKVCIYYYIGDPFYLDIESSYIKEYKQITNFIDKQGVLYKEINEIDYVDTTKINKNNELICNTISEV